MTARSPSAAAPAASSTSAPPRRCGTPQQRRRRRVAQPQALDLALEADEVARLQLVQELRARAAAGTPWASSSAGYSAASPSPIR